MPHQLARDEFWELACWDERVKNAQMVLGVCEGERAQARARILAAHGLPPGTPIAADGSLPCAQGGDGER